MGNTSTLSTSTRSTPVHRRPWLPAVAVMCVLLLCAPPSHAEVGTGSITGVVLDARTHQPIPSANILLKGTSRGAAADLDGRFQILHVEPGTWTLEVSALGYLTRTQHEIAVTPGRTPDLEIELEPTALEGKAVTYAVSSHTVSTPDMPTSSRNLRYEEVRRAPGGLEDVQRTIEALPGVVNSDDSDNAIVVRGGAQDENLTVIDGIFIENTNHLTFGNDVKGNGGPINGLDTEFLRDVTFASGGFSVKYGNKMSSVLDLDLREGNRERFAGAADINMAGAGGYLEGPIVKDRGSFMVSAHRSYLSLIPKESVGVDAWPEYWHTQMKATYDLSDRQKLTVDGLFMSDHVSNPWDRQASKPNLAGGIDALNLQTERWMLGGRLRSLWAHGYSNLVLARTLASADWDTWHAQHPSSAPAFLQLYNQQARTVTNDQLSFNYNGEAFGKDRWSAGIELRPLRYDNRTFLHGDSILYDDGYLGHGTDGQPDFFRYPNQSERADQRANRFAAFAQYTFSPLSTLDITAGLRGDRYDYANSNQLSPRASLHWQFRPRWAMNLATGRYGQPHDPSVYMDPEGRTANHDLPYSDALQYIAGLTFQPRSSSLFSLEGYLKKYDHLLVSEQDVVRQRTGDRRYTSDALLPEGKRSAWGVEFFAQQKLNTNWYGTLSYSYGMATQKDPAFGEYPADFDYRHVGTAVLGYKTCLITHKGYRDFLRSPYGWWLWALPLNGDEVTFSSRYRVMGGHPMTEQIWYPEGAASPEPIFEGHWEDGPHNGARYPLYSRWDIRIDSKFYYGSSALIWYVESQNVDDHPNVAEIQYLSNGQRDLIYQFRQTWILGVRYEF